MKEHRRSIEQAVEPIQYSAVPGNQVAAVFYLQIPFDRGYDCVPNEAADSDQQSRQ